MKYTAYELSKQVPNGEFKEFEQGISDNKTINAPVYYSKNVTLFESLVQRILVPITPTDSSRQVYIENAIQAFEISLKHGADCTRVCPRLQKMAQKLSIEKTRFQTALQALQRKEPTQESVVSQALKKAIDAISTKQGHLSTLVNILKKHGKEIDIPSLEEKGEPKGLGKNLAQDGLEAETFMIIKAIMDSGNLAAFEQLIQLGIIDPQGKACQYHEEEAAYTQKDDYAPTWLDVVLEELRALDTDLNLQSYGIKFAGENNQLKHKNYVKLLEILLAHGANPTKSPTTHYFHNKVPGTPLENWKNEVEKYSTSHKQKEECVSKLETLSSDPQQTFGLVKARTDSTTDMEKKRIEMEFPELLMAKRELDKLETLLQSGEVDANLRLQYGRTMLQAAAFNQSIDGVELLLKYGADPRAKSEFPEDQGATAAALLQASITKQAAQDLPLYTRKQQVLGILETAGLGQTGQYKKEAEGRESKEIERTIEGTAEKTHQILQGCIQDAKEATNTWEASKNEPGNLARPLLFCQTAYGKISTIEGLPKDPQESKKTTFQEVEQRFQFMSTEPYLAKLPETVERSLFEQLVAIILNFIRQAWQHASQKPSLFKQPENQNTLEMAPPTTAPTVPQVTPFLS